MMRRAAIIVALLLVLAGMALAQDWTYGVVVHSGDRSATRNLYFGVDYRASDCFDSGIDVPLVPGVPGAYYCYFIAPCTDGFPEGMDPYLTKDMRSSEDTTYEATWVIRESGDVSPDARLVTWVIDDLPLVEDTTGEKALAEIMQIGVRMIGSEDPPSTWTDMSSVDSLNFSPGQEVVIKAIMVGGVDHLPPWVENKYPSEGAEGVSRTDSVLFNIRDDVSGVDLSSVEVFLTFNNATLDSTADITDLGVFSPLAGAGGYHFLYQHPGEEFPGTTEVCVNVLGQDLADPVHIMDTVVWCFTTRLEIGEIDSFPPYFEMWTHAGMPLDITIMDTVNFMDQISFNVRDAEFGVDITTLEVIVDGVDRTAEVGTTRIGMYEEYNVVIPPFPAEGWAQGMPHSVEVTVCDFAPNCTTVTFDFYVPLPEDLVDWQFDVTVTREGTPSYLRFGMSDGALTGFDIFDQIRWPVPGFYAYFPLDDPTVMDTMLSRDIRPLHHGTEIWEVNATGGSGDFEVTWNPDAIPDSIGSYTFALYIGHGVPGGAVSWDDMSLFSSYPIGSDEIIYFKVEIRTETGTAPVLVNADPSPGETNVPVSTNICFDIVDDVGVDTTTLQVWMNSLDVSDGFEITNVLPNGYTFCYDPPGFLELYETYEIRVRVSDIDVSVHTLDTVYSFESGGFCGPQFTLDITAYDSTTTDSLYFETVTIGTDSLATDGYDSGIDFPAPPPIGFGAVSINPDTTDTLFEDLARDIRNNCNQSQWKIRLIVPAPPHSPEALWLEWNPDDVPVSSMWCMKIAAGTYASPPIDEDYEFMNEISRLDLASGEIAYIKFTTACDTTDVYCVNGVVTDELTDLPVEDAQVIIGGLSDFTGPDGTYEVCGLPDGEYSVIAIATGYETLSTDVTISGADVNLDLELTPEGYDVCGTTFVEGTATGGVHIVFGPAETYSGTGGTYCVHLTAGTYEVSADYSGYPTYIDTVDVSSDMTYNIDIVSGTFEVSGTGSLEGELSEGITISVDGTPTATTDSTGAYTMEVDYGIHTITASYPGYADDDTTLLVDDDMTIDFDLSGAPVDVCVEVTLEGATDNAGALVQMPPASEQITPASGLVCFNNMDWGEYTITISKEYFATVETTITANMDTTIAITLPYYYEPTGLTCEFSPTQRPFDIGETLKVIVDWTEPSSSYLTVDSYDIYRNGEFLGNVAAPPYNDYDVVDGESYSYEVVTIYDDTGESPASEACEVEVDVAADDNVLLLIDFDNGAGFADDMALALESIDVTDYSMTDPDEDIALTGRFVLDDYDAIFVVLGVRGDGSDATMSTEMQDLLLDYIDDGGYIYVCGPDFAQDYTGTDLLARFDFTATDGADSTTGNVETVKMNSDFYSGSAWRSDYAYQTTADHYVDELTPYGLGRVALYANLDSIVVGVHRAYTRVYTSVYLTALDHAGRFIGGILDLFGIENTEIVEIPQKPKAFTIGVNPNPFNTTCEITFDLPENGFTNLSVYDITGSRIATLYNGNLGRGCYSTTWNANAVPSGVYLVKLTVNGRTAISRVSLIK
ncbi:hypothetical protein DRQ33_00110 [bacterium]|nr:MAG: hypothetical protein DRQ33_00110 [bacterium]